MTDELELGEWPPEKLESVPNCPVCGSAERALLHGELTDRVFRVAPGKWSLYCCLICRSAWLDPRPTPESLGLAYARYYTHDASDHPIVRRLGLMRTLLHDALNGYMNSRYGLRREPAIKLGRWLIPLLPSLRAAADADCRHMPRPPSGGGLLLDVGCGNGRFLELASEMGWRVEGIDLDPVAVETAKTLGFSVRCGTIKVLDDVSEHYDVITLSHVIEHVYDPLSLLTSLRRLLKPEGVLWLETPNLDSLGFARFGPAWRGLEPPRHLVLFNSECLIDLLKQAGFSKPRQFWRGLVSFQIFFESADLIKKNKFTRFSVKAITFIYIVVVELIEGVFRGKREFVTLVATKPPSGLKK
jgi:SAM-dependent methyltransferase